MSEATRGFIANDSGTQLFAVFGASFVSINAAGVRTTIGSLVSSRGYVGMAIGRQELVIVDGPYLYRYNLASKVFARSTAAGFNGSPRVAYIDGYFIFTKPGSDTWQIMQDGGTLDALDFAVAEGAPDALVCGVADHREAWLFGETSTEVWVNTGAADFPFERNNGAFIQTGCLGAFTVQPLDNTLIFLGRDRTGAGQVFRLQGYQAQRISTDAVDQQIQAQIAAGQDMTKAIAWTYQHRGHAFYCLQVPGVETTLCYDVATQQWHDRAELEDGEFAPFRAKFHAYAYGRHLVAGDDGVVYTLDQNAADFDGDPKAVDRITPHMQQPNLARIGFGTLQVDCTIGGAAAGSELQAMLRTSNDGGNVWSNWRTASVGKTGEYLRRVRWTRNGSARDRVWHMRVVSPPMPFGIVNASMDAQ